MARFRRRVRSRSFRVGKRRSHKSSGTSLMGSVIPAALYGAARPYVSNLVQPVTGALGAAGGYADNIVLGGIGYFAAKKGRGMIKNIGHAMLLIEAAQIGAELGGGMGGSSSGGAF